MSRKFISSKIGQLQGRIGAVAEGASPRFRLHTQRVGVLVPFYSVGQDALYAMYFDARSIGKMAARPTT